VKLRVPGSNSGSRQYPASAQGTIFLL
jgi:hypothetical protein